MNKSGLLYLVLALVGFSLAAFLFRGAYFQYGLGRTPSFYLPAVFAGMILIFATTISGWVSFLFLLRFVDEIRHEENQINLLGKGKNVLMLVDSIHVIKRLKDPHESIPSLAIFRAGGKIWIGNCREQDL